MKSAGRVVTTLVVVALAALALAAAPRQGPLPQPSAAVGLGFEEPTPRYSTVTREVRDGDDAGSILRELGAPSGILAAAGSRISRINAEDRFHLDYDRELGGEAWRLRFERAPQRSTGNIVVVERDGDGWVAGSRPIPYTIRDGVKILTIEQGGSLWQASTDAGMRDAQIDEIAGIFEYDVDFNTEIHPGDTIRIVAESLLADDGAEGVGSIRAAELVNNSKTYTAIRYVLRDGSVGWFAADGTGRRRPFLRSPLAFSRVTSSFDLKRKHPILKYTRAHLGVDLGAPTGTPVRAVADGVVTTAGRNGGYGNFVRIDHEGPVDTGYAHLSAILVRNGARVKQGDVIGKVGMTGTATGPHLHYEFRQNGKHVNPMTVALPMTGSLPDDEREAFFKVRDAVLPLLHPPATAAAE